MSTYSTTGLHDTSAITGTSNQRVSLSQALQDGYFLVYLIKQGYAPQNADDFAKKVESLLNIFENKARAMNASTDDIYQAKYAFCGLLDETVLQHESPCRDEWQMRPAQLRFFGDHLAGEHFFNALEEVRALGKVKQQVLEVKYTCMLLGFKGKYLLESPEKLNYLIGRVGDELKSMRGQESGLAPFWAIPDNVKHLIKYEVPLWLFWLTFFVLALIVFTSLRWLLDDQFKSIMEPFGSIILDVKRQPYLEITW